MIVAILIVAGLCLGSFVNALVWRLHEQARSGKRDKVVIASEVEMSHSKKRESHTSENTIPAAGLSIMHGRSMCPACKHELAVKDLVPVFSWITLNGKCRYCSKPISYQYPLVELATACLFVASYIWWPETFSGAQTAIFVIWLLLLTGFMALLVYDTRWKLLPNRITYPLSLLAAVQAVIVIISADRPLTKLLNIILAVAVGGGIFYVLFQVSGGKWIGGGDVKLGWLLGLIAATPARSLLFIFIAAIGGTLLSVPFLATGRLKRTSTIPFGPFLIVGLIIVQLFGASILHWYQQTFITF